MSTLPTPVPTACTLEAFRAHTFVGCHACDYKAFNMIAQFAQDESQSYEDRAEALKIMATKGMGVSAKDDPSLLWPAEKLVKAFLECSK